MLGLTGSICCAFLGAQGCDTPPLKATRVLWEPRAMAQGQEVSLYSDGETYGVSIVLSDFGPPGICPLDGSVMITETVPDGWSVSSMSDGGTLAGTRVVWVVFPAGWSGTKSLAYQVTAGGRGLVCFHGEFIEAVSDRVYPVEGDRCAASGDVGGLVPVVFRRGDADTSGEVDISDVVFTLSYLFTGGRVPKCTDAADADDSGRVGIADPILLLNYLFREGRSPPDPGPHVCGPDGTPDTLGPCLYDPPAAFKCPG